MPSIEEIIATDTFLKRLTQQIYSTLTERSATVYDSTDGFVEGTVTRFEIDSGPVCDELEGEASDWSVVFTGNGTASVDYKIADGEDRDSDISGPFEGFANITLPESMLSADAAAQTLQLIVTIESATLEEEEPVDDSDVN